MTRIRLALIAGAGSALLLGGAFVFQALGYAPCKMCIWQRWPHALAIVLGVAALFIPAVWLMWIGALAMAVTAGIGFYHTGVERGWFEGPTSCTSGDISNLSSEELMQQILSAPLVRCDEVAWSLAGLSMASWNMILSLVLMAIWVAAARAK